MVLCFPWWNKHCKTIIHSVRPDLKTYYQEQWKPLGNYAAFLTIWFPKAGPEPEGCYLCFPVTIPFVEPKNLLFISHIWMKSAGWVAVGHCTWLPSYTLRPRCALASTPSPWLFFGRPHMPTTPPAGLRGAALSPSQDRLAHRRAGSRGRWRGANEAGLIFLFIQVLNLKNTLSILSYLNVLTA